MGRDPSPVPSASRSTLSSAQDETDRWRRHSDSSGAGARQFQCRARMDGLGRSTDRRFIQFAAAAVRCRLASCVGSLVRATRSTNLSKRDCRMIRPGIISDQLFTWSDIYAQNLNRRLAKTPPGPSPQIPFSGGHPPRLSHRTLQALWQARLQVCPGSGSRPEVLSVGQLSPFAPANGLCPARVPCPDQEVSCQLSACSRDLRGDLRNQPRTVAPQRGPLRNRDERNIFLAHRASRSGIRRHPSRQHARGLARRPSRLPDNHGGK